MTDVNTLPVLKHDPSTNDYVADFRLRVPAELFQRAFFKRIADDGAINLTDADALREVIETVGKVTNWIGHPHATITPIPAAAPVIKEQVREAAQTVETLDASQHASKSHMTLLSEELRTKAEHVAPHLWEETLLTPTPPKELSPQEGESWEGFCQWLEKKQHTSPMLLALKDQTFYWKKYREDVGRVRYNERKILAHLRAEWEHGDFAIDPQAEEEERVYQEAQHKGLTMKIETMAGAVNGSRNR